MGHRFIHSIVCRVNGIESYLLVRLSSEWNRSLSAPQVIGWIRHRPICWTGYRVHETKAHPLHRLSSVWSVYDTRPSSFLQVIEWMGHKPICSTNYRVNSIQAYSLDRLLSEWDTRPIAWWVIEWMRHSPVRSMGYRVNWTHARSLNSLSIK